MVWNLSRREHLCDALFHRSCVNAVVSYHMFRSLSPLPVVGLVSQVDPGPSFTGPLPLRFSHYISVAVSRLGAGNTPVGDVGHFGGIE